MHKEKRPISFKLTPRSLKKAPSKVRITNKGMPEAKPKTRQMPILILKTSRKRFLVCLTLLTVALSTFTNTSL